MSLPNASNLFPLPNRAASERELFQHNSTHSNNKFGDEDRLLEEDAESAITDLAGSAMSPYSTVYLQRSASADNTMTRENRENPSRHRKAARRRRLRSALIRQRRQSLSLAYTHANSTIGSIRRKPVPLQPKALAVTAAPLEPASEEKDDEDEEDDDEEDEEQTGSSNFFFSLDNRRKLLLIVLGVSDMCAYICLSMMAPFFPQEAELKGLTNTLSGWIFGIFALVEVVFCPIFANYMSRLGVRFTYIAGMFVAACCNVLFGFLDETPSDKDGGTLFAILCFVVRGFQALGMAAYLTAAFTILSIEYRKHISKAFAFNETLVAVGFMLGPTIGGALYSVGGFKLPFIALGIVLLILSVVNYFLLPLSSDVKDIQSESFSMLKFLTLPQIFITALAVATSAVGMSVLDPTLEPHLREFGFDTSLVGLMFLIPSAVYTLTTPVVGWLCNKFSAYWMVVGGFIGLTLSMLVLAASPLFGFPIGYNELYVNILALVAMGITFGFALIPTFEMMLNVCILVGFHNSIALYSAVGGLWSSAYALGDFAGPVLGGALLDTVGFQWGITIVAAIPCCQLILLLVVGAATKCKIAKLEDEVARIEAEETTPEEKLVKANEQTPLLSNTEQKV